MKRPLVRTRPLPSRPPLAFRPSWRVLSSFGPLATSTTPGRPVAAATSSPPAVAATPSAIGIATASVAIAATSVAMASAVPAIGIAPAVSHTGVHVGVHVDIADSQDNAAPVRAIITPVTAIAPMAAPIAPPAVAATSTHKSRRAPAGTPPSRAERRVVGGDRQNHQNDDSQGLRDCRPDIHNASPAPRWSTCRTRVRSCFHTIIARPARAFGYRRRPLANASGRL